MLELIFNGSAEGLLWGEGRLRSTGLGRVRNSQEIEAVGIVRINLGFYGGSGKRILKVWPVWWFE